MNKILISESEKIKIRKMYGLLNEVETITPSFVSDVTCSVCRGVETGLFKLENGAYEVQNFLNYAGHDVPIDGDFGIKTATALATWVYGYKEGIRTPRQLAERMKKDGWNVGTITDTPYGRQMAQELAKLIKKICNGFSAPCKKQREDVAKYFAERKDFNKQRNEFHPDKIPTLHKQKQFCETELNKIIPKVKQEFTNWINNTKTQRKILSTDLIDELKKIINGIGKNLYSCAGPYDFEEFFKKEAEGFYSPTFNKIKVNYEDFEKDKLLSLLIHETTHWIEGNLSKKGNIKQTINQPGDVKKVYPLSIKSKYETDEEIKHNLYDWRVTFSKKSLKNVPAVSIQQLQSIGISKDVVQSLIDNWNLEIALGGNKYGCSRKEKEANLKSIRKLYTGTLFGELTKENLRDIILGKKDDSDEYLFIICWVGANFNPAPFDFLKFSNALAVNEKPTDDTNIQNNQPLNLDFSDIDPMA